MAIPLVRGIAALASRPDYQVRGAALASQPAGRPGGLLLAANHVSSLDPVLLARFVLEFGRIPRFLAKHQLFERPLLGTVLGGAGQIPVYRHRGNAADALAAAVTALRMGDLVVIYPEGTTTRAPDLWPMQARNGVARLALTADVPVVPVAHWGAHLVVGPGLRLRPRQPYSVLAGPALDLSAWRAERGRPSAAALQAVTELVMARIREQLADLRSEEAPSEVWDPRRVGRW